jgi:hypothetical protein
MSGCKGDTLRRDALKRADSALCGRVISCGRSHRVAISNHRLVSFDDSQVIFRWRDSAHNNEQKLMTLSPDEFLRRFLLHLLPKGFVRIRHFGFLANRRRAALLPRCFAALHATPSKNASEPLTPPTAHPLWRCPKCGGPMAVVERFTAAQLQLRSPPLLAAMGRKKRGWDRIQRA